MGAINTAAYTPLSPAQKQRERQLIRRLDRLPKGSSPYRRAYSLTISITRVNPIAATAYYKKALTKLPIEVLLTKKNIFASRVSHIVSKSNLPKEKSIKIQTAIFKASIFDFVVIPNPSPTPEVTPQAKQDTAANP